MAASLIVHDAIRAGVLEGIEHGMTQAASARRVGISPDTLAEWLARGRGTGSRGDTDGVYADFVEEVEKAKSKGIYLMLKAIRSAAQAPHGKGWAAAAWLLSKWDPATYGDKIEVRGEIEHRKTYRFEAPVVPEPLEPKEVEVEVIDVLPEVGELPERDGDG